MISAPEVTATRRETVGDEWDRLKGPPCPSCGEETYRLFRSLDGDGKVCLHCHRKQVGRYEKKMELKSRVRELSSIFRARRRR